GRQVVPAGAAGGLGIGGDDRDTRLHQVVPVFDLFGIALTHQEDDGGGVGGAVVGQFLLPARLDQGLLGDGVDVVGQSQGDHISLEAVDDSTGLFAGTAMGLFDGDVVTGFTLPVRSESLVEICVQFAGWVIGD